MLAEIDTRSVQTSSVKLANGGDAFLATPSAPGPHPCIILMHERYGLVQHTKDLAVRFATEGHVALAPNLYFRAPNQEEVMRGEATVQVSDELKRHYGDKVFDTVIPRNIRIAEAPSFGKPVLLHDPQSKGALAHLQFARELLERNGIAVAEAA